MNTPPLHSNHAPRLIRAASFLLFAFSVVGPNHASTTIHGTTTYFNGEITKESARALIARLEQGATTLVIKSGGGDAEMALKIAEPIVKNQTTVIVNDYCFSSCANYIFISAKSKFLPPGGHARSHAEKSGQAERAQVRADHHSAELHAGRLDRVERGGRAL